MDNENVHFSTIGCVVKNVYFWNTLDFPTKLGRILGSELIFYQIQIQLKVSTTKEWKSIILVVKMTQFVGGKDFSYLPGFLKPTIK